MTEEAALFWKHAQSALAAASRNIDIDASTAANRAYYAAFYAVSALFANENKTFKRHSAVDAAVHRDLVNTGRWTSELGDAFRELRRLRSVADYDVTQFITADQAREALSSATRIVNAVAPELPPPT